MVRTTSPNKKSSKLKQERLKARKSVHPIPRQQVGRPPVYDSTIHPDLAYKFCLLGCNNERLGNLLGVSVQTIEFWLKEYPQFLGAVKEGRENADANVAKSLYHRACGYTHEDLYVTSYQGEIITHPIIKHYPPDVGAATLWLTNRTKQKPPEERWTVRQETELTGKDGESLNIGNVVVVLPPEKNING